MAQVDTSIAMGFRPVQIPLEESPLNRLRERAEFENSLLKSQEMQRNVQERNALARIMSEPGVDFGSDVFMNRVLAEAPGMYEGIATRAAQRENLIAQRETRKAEAEKRKREQERETFETQVGEIIGYNTVKDVETDIATKEKAGAITPQQAAVLRSNLPTDDNKLDSWRITTLRGLMPPKERLADIRAESKETREQSKPVVVSQGSSLVSPTGQVVYTAPASLTEPELVKEYKFATDPARGKDRFTGSLLSFKEAVARAGRTPAQSDNPAKVAHTSTDDQGNVTFYNAFGQVIRKETNAGKRSPTLIKQEQAQKNLSRDIERTTNELVEITKDGGLIDQSTGSYAGKAIDVGARVFGKAMPGDIAAGKLAPIADMVLKMVPRFEGPQSDKDTQSYKEAAGQLADPNLPREIRKAAGKEILRLMKERKKEFGVEGMEVAPNAPDPLGIR